MQHDISRKLAGKLEYYKKWWDLKNDKALISYKIIKQSEKLNPNSFWADPQSKPDLEGLASFNVDSCRISEYYGAAYPVVYHRWGKRGTPSVIANYMHGTIGFMETTVWCHGDLPDLKNFSWKTDQHNIWYKSSMELHQALLARCEGDFIVSYPDLGDTLTCLSLLRSNDKLLLDTIDQPDEIKRLREEFCDTWKSYHNLFHQKYREKLPGDSSFMVWAPGKTYACQCDFSTMISPDMFQEFVVPEIKTMSQYLENIVWHLDGPDEIRHLHHLLACDEIKIIQWVPGAGNPPCADDCWTDMLRKIQDRGKGLLLSVNNLSDLKKILETYSPQGLLVNVFGLSDFSEKTEIQKLAENCL